MWEALFKRYWQVSLFKETPENTPYSSGLLWVAAFSFFLLILVQWFIADVKHQFSLLISVFAASSLLCSYFVYTWILLKLYHKVNRMMQTLTSLFMCHIIIHLCAFPLLLLTPFIIAANMNQVVALLISIIYLFLTLALTAWQFLITAHIYKNTLEVDYLNSFLASFGLLACNILMASFW